MKLSPSPGGVLLAASLFIAGACGLRAASDVTVSSAATTGGGFAGTNPNVFTPTAATAVASVTTIQASLNGGNAVTINTASAAGGHGDLTVSSSLSKTSGGSSLLTLNAVRDLAIDSTLSSATGAMPLVLNAGRNISNSQTLATNGGNITLNPAQAFTVGAAIDAGAGQVLITTGSVESGSDYTITGSSVQVAGGAALRLQGSITGPVTVVGTISPKAADGTGFLQVDGSLTLQGTATTSIDLGGTTQGSSHDWINASNAITVAGALQVNLVNNFHDTISGDSVFTVLQGGSVSGTFSGLPNGSRITLANDFGSLRVNYTDTTVTLDDWKPVIVDLTWDPGTTDAGTAVFTNTNTRAGRHYFRVLTQGSDIGAWRTRLTLASGEAELYLSKTNLPTIGNSEFSSIQNGGDGLMLRDDEFAAAEEWFILVNATPGAQWSVFSGRAFVHDLGALPFTDGNGNLQYDIGEAVTPQTAAAAPMPPEGIRFYRATVPAGTPAWSLWLNGSTRDLAIRTTMVPFHSSTSYYTRKQSGQMLVVPTVLGTGSNAYFVSVVAPQGESIGLDSRIQTVTDIDFQSTTLPPPVSGPPYRVFRTQVPVDQLAWDVSTTAIAGDPNVCVRKNNVPGEWDNEAFSDATGSTTDSVTLVPDFLTNGTWFITVYGTGNYTFTLKSGDPVITPLNFTDLKINDQTDRAGWRYYALTNIPAQVGSLGWELLLSNQVPGTQIALRRNKVPSRWLYRADGNMSTPSDTNYQHMDYYGTSGFLQRPGHQADVWYVGIYTPQQALGEFSLDVHPIVPATVGFNGGNTAVSGLEPGKWKFQRIEVPPGVLGWDLRLRAVSGPLPQMYVRRDLLPPAEYPYNNFGQSSWGGWPSGYQWGGGIDWTGRGDNDPLTSGTQPVPERLVMGAGRPLEPGTYYVGVYNTGYNSQTDQSGPTSYTIDSRGIGGAGSGLTYEVQPALAFNGGSAAISNLAPREARYYKVTIPANTPSWEVTLTPSAGEMLLAVRRGTIPDFNAYGSSGNAGPSSSDGDLQVKMQKDGPERYVLLPRQNEDYLVAGDYYLAVVGEGVNPPDSYTIGTGTSSGTLTSHGPLAVTDLGAAGGTPVERALTLASGQVQAYTFTVPEGAASLEVRLDNRVGNPQMALARTTGIVNPPLFYVWGGYGYDYYGYSGGQTNATITDDNLLTLTNPEAGSYSLVVRAARTPVPPYDNYPAASADLVVRQVPRLPLNYAASLNGNGLSNTATRQLLDSQKEFFEVPVPATLGGQPVIGWLIKVDHLQGDTTLKIYKTWDAPNTGVTVYGNTALVVPPFLTPGDTWFVEVQASGLTNYTITSLPITLERPVWTMPAGHNVNFGDSGSDSGGVPLPGDRGIDIGQDEWHFYAIDVPEGNSGLLRTELQAINGDPNLYLREDGVPTTDHDSNGGEWGGWSLVSRSLTSTASEYGNWVPVDGRYQRQLRAGRWYLGVKANGASNARYRLIVSNGQVTDLPLNGGSVSNQILVGRDWRYYRFTVAGDAPKTWNLTFSQQVGDVNMWLRDTMPPGNQNDGLEADTQDGLRSWYTDDKNQGSYSYIGQDSAGTYNFNTPPLRPGSTYYVGFRAANDATFSFSSTSSGGTIGVLPVLDYYTGSINTSISAGSSLLYRIPVPPEATHLKWTATHSSDVQLRLEQGTLPDTTGAQHWISGGGENVTFNQALTQDSNWPWLPGQHYYLRVVNTSGTAQTVVLTMAGNTYANWPLLATVPVDRRGALDRNGPLDMQNLLAFAMGLNPLTAQPADLPSMVSLDGGSGTATFRYRRAKDIAGTTLSPMTSTNLETWQPATILGSIVVQDGGDWEVIEVQVPTSPEGRLFFLVQAILTGL